MYPKFKWVIVSEFLIAVSYLFFHSYVLTGVFKLSRGSSEKQRATNLSSGCRNLDLSTNCYLSILPLQLKALRKDKNCYKAKCFYYVMMFCSNNWTLASMMPCYCSPGKTENYPYSYNSFSLFHWQAYVQLHSINARMRATINISPPRHREEELMIMGHPLLSRLPLLLYVCVCFLALKRPWYGNILAEKYTWPTVWMEINRVVWFCST